MPEIIAQLRADHVNVTRLLNLLERQLEAVHEGTKSDFELMRDMMVYMTRYPDRHHHPKEDLIFRRLRERDASTRLLVETLLEEHKALAEKGAKFLDTLQHVADGAMIRREVLEAQGRDYVAFLRFHHDREEGEVFSLAERLLSDDDWAEIDRALEHRDDPLFGKIIDEDLRALYEFVVLEN